MNQNEINEYIKKNIDNLSIEDAWNTYVRASYLNNNKQISLNKLSDFDREFLEKILNKIENKEDEVTISISNSPLFVKTEEIKLGKNLESLVQLRNYNTNMFKRLKGNVFQDIFMFVLKYMIYLILILVGLQFAKIIDYKEYWDDIVIKQNTIVAKVSKERKVHKKNDRYSLTIKTTPKNIKIRILNIKSKYHNGIKLKPGKYKIELSKSGYKMKIFIIQIKNKNLVILENLVTK